FHIPNPGHKLRPGMYATVRIDVPPAQIGALARAAAEDWPLLSAADAAAHGLFAPAGPGAGAGPSPWLRAAGQQAALQRGLVPAVPDGAVIDTGSLRVVYREAAPHVYEGVAVRLGPRMAEPGSATAFYPVLGGLAAGDRVVTNGSFLI